MITQHIVSFEVLTAQGHVQEVEYIYWEPRCDYCAATMPTAFSMAYATPYEAFRGAVRDGWDYQRTDKRLTCPICACSKVVEQEPVKRKRGRPRKNPLPETGAKQGTVNDV